MKTTGFRPLGQGSSLAISVATVSALVALWFAATNLGWVKPLFLPSPQSVFLQLYGMAEVASIGTLLRKEDHVRALGPDPWLLRSCGRPSLAIDVRVVDPDGRDVAEGERGEVIFGGPHLMREYHRDPERTADAVIDGWVHSGDIAERNPESYRENPYYAQLQGAIVAYRDALKQIERVGSVEEQAVLA